jgi:hypothetical protein
MTRNSDSDYGFARARDQAFDAVIRLWERRKKEGLTQAQLAAAMGRDSGWVSRHLRGPGNWTLRTVGAFVAGLQGELEIAAYPLEEPLQPLSNFDAYLGYQDAQTGPTPRNQGPQAGPTPTSQLPDYLKNRIENPNAALV